MQIAPDLCVLVADYGLGDHYIVAGFAEAVARQTGLRVAVAGRPHLAFLGKIFPALGGRYLDWPEKLSPASIREDKIRGGALFHAHFPGLELMRAVGYGDFHFLDAYRCRLGLPKEATLSRATLPSASEIAVAKAALRAQGLKPESTVILGIEARTTPMDGVTTEFWSHVCNALEAQGLTPLINVGPATKVPSRALSRAIALPELRAFAMATAGVCSVRSGFSDLVCDLPCPQFVVYPEVRYWAGPLLRGTTFEHYGLATTPKERVVTPANATDAAREIAAHFVAAKTHAPIERLAS